MIRLCLILTLIPCLIFAQEKTPPVEQPDPLWKQPYTAQDFSHLLGMKGFSNDALNMHFKLYEGYVKNTNLLLSILSSYDKEGKTRTPQYAGLKRMLGWEFDGMRLHELYFSSLGGDGTINENSELYQMLVKEFGSFDAWQEDFISTGSIRGIGWAILYRDPQTGRLINCWINEHNLGHLAGTTPLLPMDVFEHAYLLDYGLDRSAYINAFLNNVDWKVVEERFNQSLQTKDEGKPASS